MKTFVVFRVPGTGWVDGKDTREQPGWDEHARFMDSLHDGGHVVVAGPYEDRSRVLLIVRASSREKAGRMFDEDPWTKTQVLATNEVHAWEAFLFPPGWPRS